MFTPIKLSVVCLGAAILLSGCGDESTIVIDDQTVETETVADTPDNKPSTEKKDQGMWGVRHVRNLFHSDDNDNDAKNEVTTTTTDDSISFSKTDKGAEFVEEKEVTVTERWNPSDAELQDPDYEYAKKAVRQGNYSEAKHLLLNVVKRHPDSTKAWSWLGDSHYNLLELEQAIQAYRKALTLYPENYFAMRGEGFARLHLGFDLWRSGRRREAHEEFRQSLKILQDCLRIYPGDLEAMYGRSLAAEGASRKLYQNAVSQLRRENKEMAESEARNCMEVIDEGIESARQRMYKNPDEVGPRSIAGGLFQRRAILQKTFNRLSSAVEDMEQAIKAYESILQISPDNYLAKAELKKCKSYLGKWEKELNAKPDTSTM